MIAVFLTRLWSRIWPYIAAIGAAFAAVLAIRQSGRAAGKQEIRQEINEANLKAVERARYVENETASMDDDSVADELIRDWVRERRR